MAFTTQNIEKKTYSILKVLSNSPEPLGSIVIARKLQDLGVDLGQRAVRYHLTLTDRQGLTRLAGRRDGRVITQHGIRELRQGMVKEKVGFAISRIEQLAVIATFDFARRSGSVPVNVSLVNRSEYARALEAMEPAFRAGMCAGGLVMEARSGERIGDIIVPKDTVAIVTICSIVIISALVKACIPVSPRFGGLLQMQKHKPWRFTDLIQYSGCTLDPAEVFIKARMTSVGQAVKTGNGNVLANFHEIPSICRQKAVDISEGFQAAGMKGIFIAGGVSEPVCEIPVDPNRTGIVVTGGLNPAAVVHECGIRVESFAMSTVVDYQELVPFESLLRRRDASARGDFG